MRRVLAALLLFLGCGDSTEPELGILEISITTVGADLDEDGYLLRLNGGPPGTVGLVATIRLEQYPAGRHLVTLDGVAENCELNRAPLHTFLVRPGEVTRVEFQVTCYPTGILILARTEGLDLDPDGYSVTVGTRPPEIVGANGSLMVGRLTAGEAYQVRISGIASNCALLDDAVRVVTAARGLTPANFEFSCMANSGVVEVRTMTTGEDLDPDGYAIQVGNGPVQEGTAINGLLRIRQVPAGVHGVALTGIASNCLFQNGQTPVQSIQIRAGGFIRDTARVRFELTCGRTEKIAFLRDQGVMVMYADGSNPIWIGEGRGSPAWSPDGRRLVWEGRTCSFYYYYYYSNCADRGLFISQPNGAFERELTDNEKDQSPAWSPDGGTIAFVREGRLMLIRPDGTDLRPREPPRSGVAEPAWSPDGEWLAYTCVIEAGNHDICLINRDGSTDVRLTTHPAEDRDPAWSPDGTRIAFTTRRFGGEFIAHMAAMDGSDLTQLVEGRSPSWSRDGEHLVFERVHRGLSIIRRNGTGHATLTGRNDTQPAWRP